MGRDQRFFDELFRDQSFAMKPGMAALRWQREAVEAYQDSLDAHAESHGLNGDWGQHRFCLYAGTGAGKTIGVGLLMSLMLGTKRVGQVVFVCPNRAIKRKAARVFREVFGIDLASFHASKHRDGIPRTKQGYILTYAHLMNDPALHSRICAPERTLIVFDEVHHLAEKNEWGGKALEAFGTVPHVISMTGTPWRTKEETIPFVTYEDTDIEDVKRFSADPERGTGYTYSLGRAIVDGVCRKPVFIWHDGTVRIRIPGAGERTVTFEDEKVTDGIAALRLRGAVAYGSTSRRTMLAAAVAHAREMGGKLIIFLGGDTEGDQTPTEDATKYLPKELEELGIEPGEYLAVTCNDKEAPDKLDSFGPSPAWILISINMVSEGNDIPQLTEALFLTTISALQTTIQRIGRILRRMGPNDPHKVAYVHMFGDPRIKKWAVKLEEDVEAWREINLGRQHREPPEDGHGDGADDRQNRSEAIGIAGGNVSSVTIGEHDFAAEVLREKERELVECKLPHTLLHILVDLIREARHVDGNDPR